MLKFSVERKSVHREHENVIINVGTLGDTIECEPPHTGMPDTWTVWVLDLGDVAKAASLLHALELGVALAARWIAVELLKAPAEPGDGEAGDGVTLWFPQIEVGSGGRSATRELRLGGKVDLPDFLAYLYGRGVALSYPGAREDSSSASCASLEQALAVLIGHAAPWIAAALVREIAS